MRRAFYIVLLLLFLVPLHAEQDEQFMYYWYAAKEAIQNEQYPEAYVLLQFCDEYRRSIT